MTPDSLPQPFSQFPWSKSYPVDIDWNAPLTPGTMVDLFDAAVKKHGDRTCLNFMGKTLTYTEVGEMVDRFAKGLQDQGVGPGAKVGLCLPNSTFYVIAYHAALKAGATVVNFNPLYAEKEIEHQIKDSDADVMVTLDLKKTFPKVERMLGAAGSPLKKIVVCDIADALPWHKKVAYSVMDTVKGWFGKGEAARVPKDKNHLSFKKLLKSKGKPKPAAVKPEDVAVLQYTGGTTGVPKAAMLTHANLTANTQQAVLWFATAANDNGGRQEKMLAVLPFFHVFSMTVQMNLSLQIGAELVMVPRFELDNLLKTISDEKPTMFAAVPTIYKAIIDCKTLDDYDLSSLKVCLSGGAPLPQQTMEGFRTLTGVELIEGYGLSETSPIATANPIKGAKKLNSVGMPVPRTEVKIANVEFPDQSQPVNVSGEICLRGPQIMKGYWKRPDETDKVMDKEGYFHTGDVGYVDNDGYIFIVDRIKDMIIASGMKVFPRKVEEAIMKHEAVSEVIVAGVKDDYRGETVKAFIVLKEGKEISAGDLTAFLKDHLSPYELPKQVEFRDSLPKTMIGKPDKKALLAEEKRKAEEAAQKKAAAPKPPAP